MDRTCDTYTEPKLILAPLQGFTDLSYRTVYSRHFTGLDEALAPFLSALGKEGRINPKRLAGLDPEVNRAIPVVPQILGNNAEDFLFLAGRLERMGHTHVNWNLGCPHSRIVKKMRGSGLLPYPEKIDCFLDKVFSKTQCRVSVKVRLGRYDQGEIFRLLRVFDRYPLKEIVLHPRTAIQVYTGKADLDAFLAVGESTGHKLVYNGDIICPDTFESVRKKSPWGTDFMIGRGVLADPFLPERIKTGCVRQGRDGQEAAEKIHEFMTDLFEAYLSAPAKKYDPWKITCRMKGFWSYLESSFADGRVPFKKILASDSPKAFQQAVADFFEGNPVFGPRK